MADSSRVRVSIVAESTFGTTPASPTMLALPITGVSMKDRVGYVESSVINSSRDVEDLVRLSKSAGGGIPCELRYSPSGGGLNLAIQSVLCSTFAAAVTPVDTLAIADGSISITRSVGSFVSDGFEVGDIIKVSNYSGTQGTHYRRLTSVAALELQVEGSSFTGADSSVTVTRGARIKNGTTTPSFTVEVAYLDLQKAHIFTGCVFSMADWNVAIGSLATLVFSLDAKTSTRVNALSTDVFITGATYSAAATHPSLEPIGVTEIQGGGADYAASSIAASWNNNVSAREQLGTLGPVSMARRKFSVTGRINAYFENFDDHDDFANNTATDMWFVLLDANSRGWSISYPQAKFSDVDSPVTGNDADIFKTVAMTAYKDPTELCTVRLQRWD